MDELERLREQVRILHEMLMEAYQHIAQQDGLIVMQDQMLRGTLPPFPRDVN